MSLLVIRGLSKRYGPVAALADFDLAVEAGERIAVVGPSGSGKTTLLRLVAGFEQPDAGEILMDGPRIADASGAVPAHRRNIGFVTQDGALFPHLSVLQNIAFGMEGTRGARKRRARTLLDVVELPQAAGARRPHQLSGGQQQRVALARALARRPKLMLLDEPFSALDTGLREQIRAATAAILAAEGVTTVLVTHDQAEAMSFADRIAVLRDGRLVQAGPPREVYLAPVDRETAEFLGPAIVLDARIEGGIAHSRLGPLPVAGAGADSARASIMLRPEQIQLKPANGTVGAVTGRIAETVFEGAVARIRVVLPAPDGTTPEAILVRQPSVGIPPPGTAVTIHVVGPARAFG